MPVLRSAGSVHTVTAALHDSHTPAPVPPPSLHQQTGTRPACTQYEQTVGQTHWGVLIVHCCTEVCLTFKVKECTTLIGKLIVRYFKVREKYMFTFTSFPEVYAQSNVVPV